MYTLSVVMGMSIYRIIKLITSHIDRGRVPWPCTYRTIIIQWNVHSGYTCSESLLYNNTCIHYEVRRATVECVRCVYPVCEPLHIGKYLCKLSHHTQTSLHIISTILPSISTQFIFRAWVMPKQQWSSRSFGSHLCCTKKLQVSWSSTKTTPRHCGMHM